MMFAEDDEEGIVSFGVDDDDEMLELFSFGTEANPLSPTEGEQLDYKEMMQSVMPQVTEVTDDENLDDDSLIELLEQQKEITVVDPSTINTKNDTKEERNEVDMQEILDWLDADDERDKDEEERSFVEPPKPVSLESFLKKSQEPEPSAEPPEFETLEQAVKSPLSTMKQIRTLLDKESFVVAASVRPHLWCKVVCGKTLDETLQSSVADSFQQWEQSRQKDHQSPASKKQKQQIDWIQKESASLASRIVMTLNGDSQLSQRALASILLNHYTTAHKTDPSEDDNDDAGDDNDDNGNNQEQSETNNDTTDEEQSGEQSSLLDFNDPLLPPVACAILSTGVPKVAAAVMLSNIVPHFMPILALTIEERIQAANVLHSQFYLLVCYHLPYLALHLDRYFSADWYLGSPTGVLPQSWLISHLAGECSGAFMNPRWLQCLWDLILVSSNNALRFFLVMAILEQHAEQLLLLTGEALAAEIRRVMSFNYNTTEDGFAIESEEQTTTHQAVQWVHEWSDRAQTIWEATPISVVRKLKHLEDEAVNDALVKRQEAAEERMTLKLEAQARAHQEALEAERERKADEARLRLTRARLVAFYRQYNPGKESNIEKIMKTYEGRYDVLDAKLKQKYKVGFNPAMSPKNKEQAKKNRTTGFGKRDKQSEKGKGDGPEEKRPREVVVNVEPSEVVSSICWSKEVNRVKLTRIEEASKLDSERYGLLPLKFYLIDSRPEDSVLAQGRFPTSVSLSPEILLDPDRIKQQEEIIESLRGSVHICIMGEGYSALPELYGHKMTKALAEMIKQDETRNNNCALFLLKRGFPFVSSIDGGFAAAHAYLCREGPAMNLLPHNVLLDYNSEACLFGQFEKLHNSTGREKAQLKIQSLFDSSMAALTKNTIRLEKALASDEQQHQKSEQSGFARFFGGSSDQSSKETSETAPKRPLKVFGKAKNVPDTFASQEDVLLPQDKVSPSKPVDFTFRNPFARKSIEKQDSNKSLEVESVDFDKPSSHSLTVKDGKKDHVAPKAQRQSSGSFSIFKKEEGKKLIIDSTNETEGTKPRFSGLGTGLSAKFNTSVKTKTGSTATEDESIISRGFSMFGKNSDKKQQSAKSTGMANHFAGFRNRMEKMKTEVFTENKPDQSERVTTLHATSRTKSIKTATAIVSSLPASKKPGQVEKAAAPKTKNPTSSSLPTEKKAAEETADAGVNDENTTTDESESSMRQSSSKNAPTPPKEPTSQEEKPTTTESGKLAMNEEVADVKQATIETKSENKLEKNNHELETGTSESNLES